MALGKLLKVFLGMCPYLHKRPGFDERRNFFQILSVLLEALEKKLVLIFRPPASVLAGRGVAGFVVVIVLNRSTLISPLAIVCRCHFDRRQWFR